MSQCQCPNCGELFDPSAHNYNVMPPKPPKPANKMVVEWGRVAAVYAWYLEAIGAHPSTNSIPTSDTERIIWEWLRAGFTENELRQVFLNIRTGIREGKRNQGALRLSNLLDVGKFSEELSLCKARMDAKVPPAPGFTVQHMTTFAKTAEETKPQPDLSAQGRELAKAMRQATENK